MKFTLNGEKIESRNDGGFGINYRQGGIQSNESFQWEHNGIVTNVISIEVTPLKYINTP
jgi:hypothetical protein